MTESDNTPNMELGKVVVETLVSHGLIAPENQENILSTICGGRMTPGDWKSCVQIKILKDEAKVYDAKSDQED
ncbi:MAG: hypothetical protein ACYTBJ_25465 [Planctomycetota bacterium]|jgi:hypothetical protein